MMERNYCKVIFSHEYNIYVLFSWRPNKGQFFANISTHYSIQYSASVSNKEFSSSNLRPPSNHMASNIPFPPPTTTYPSIFQFPATLILLILQLWCSQAFHLFRCWCPWCLRWHGTEEAASQGCRGQQEAHEVDASHGKGRL